MKNIIELSKKNKIPVIKAGDTYYFPLFSNYKGNNVPHYKRGIAWLEDQVKIGNIFLIKESIEDIKKQFEFFRTQLKLAKKSGLEIRLDKTSYPEYSTKELHSWNSFSVHTNPKSEYFGKFCLIFPDDYSLENVDKWMLKASRLLNHWEVRCKKHPMYK